MSTPRSGLVALGVLLAACGRPHSAPVAAAPAALDCAAVAELHGAALVRAPGPDSAQAARLERVAADTALTHGLRRLLADTARMGALRRAAADTAWVAALRPHVAALQADVARLAQCAAG